MGAAQATRVVLDDPAYAAPAHVRRLTLGGRPVLFDARRQQLFELNDGADAIWRGLEGGATAAEIEAAPPFVRTSAQAWVRDGLLVPAEVLRRLGGAPVGRRTLRLDELRVEVAFFGEADPRACDAVFSQFHHPGPAAVRLSLVQAEGFTFLFRDGELQAVGASDAAMALLKAELTELYSAGVEDAFLAHGALLARGRGALLLTGPPGAGKTTLTLALAAAGWRYGGDDIIRFGPDGLASGVPFSAAVKSGAWPLAAPLWPELEGLPAWRRADGQTVKYLQPPRILAREPRALTAFVVLGRTAGAAAELQPIPSLEALTVLLESAYAARWRLTPAALEALAARLDAAACRRLVYSDLADAVAALEAYA